MKTTIKLVLIYFGIQIAAALAAMIGTSLYLLATGGNMDDLQTLMMTPAMLGSMGLMILYLWKAGYISTEKTTWSAVSPGYIVLTALVAIPAIWVIDALVTPLHLPNMIKDTFDVLQSGWIGIVCISIVGPVLEELLFRGAITKTLLSKYRPATAILLSGLVFGVFHLNPAQILPATLVGFLMAWMYYKTASLIPCILIHIVNNSLSVYLGLKYSEVETMRALIGDDKMYFILTGAAVGVLVAVIYLMNRTHLHYPWKKQDSVEILTTNE